MPIHTRTVITTCSLALVVTNLLPTLHSTSAFLTPVPQPSLTISRNQRVAPLRGRVSPLHFKPESSDEAGSINGRRRPDHDVTAPPGKGDYKKNEVR